MNPSRSAGDERDVARGLVDFFKLFSQGRRAPQEEVETALAYAAVLRPFAPQVVRMACAGIVRRGDVFAPSAPQIVAECERLIAIHPSMREPQTRRPALSAPPPAEPDADERARVAAGLRDLIRELANAADPFRRRDGGRGPDDVQARLRTAGNAPARYG